MMHPQAGPWRVDTHMIETCAPNLQVASRARRRARAALFRSHRRARTTAARRVRTSSLRRHAPAVSIAIALLHKPY